MNKNLNIFWFRRDLRLYDNTALHHALNSGLPVLPVFIFDTQILSELPVNDARVNFIYDKLYEIDAQLKKMGSSVNVYKGDPLKIWEEILTEFKIEKVYFNKDYEPYALERDKRIRNLLKENGIEVYTYKDQVIFEENEILKSDGKPYTVFTPYKNKWLEKFRDAEIFHNQIACSECFYKFKDTFPSLKEIGFKESKIKVKEYNVNDLDNYSEERDIPALDSTSYLSPHLRFGTVSIRQLVHKLKTNQTFLSELIWREFFMQILYHFPEVVDHNFKRKYDGIEWRNDENEFKAWCEGKTGYPMVDAGMRQLNQTGYMHNRVRMLTAGFLCKHLLIDWRWGEAYFASKLLDFELSSNNGNWQWAAGTGCDAAPYFRIFNPAEQQKKFDKDYHYVKRWVPEFGTSDYPKPIVGHKQARERALTEYKKGIR